MPPLPLSTPERSTAKALLDTPSDQSNSLTGPLPKILILLASYNGGRWIRAQIKSILAQQGVEVQLLIRDDGSTDTTLTEVQKIAEDDARVMLTPLSGRARSASQNFLALVAATEADGFDLVALSDQDDIWMPEKLRRAHQALQRTAAAGYSSATIAEWPNGRRKILRQSPKTTATDFLFEGAGQGCTFVLSVEFYRRCRQFLAANPTLSLGLHFHDWMFYALARAWRLDWCFDPLPTMIYRQHDANDTGSRGTASGLTMRLHRIRTHWYSTQIKKITEICATAAPRDRDIQALRSVLMLRRGWRRSAELAKICTSGGRRRPLDNAVLITACLAGWI